MNNKEYFQGAFDEIHAPDTLIRKVTNMTRKEAKKNMNLRYAVAGFAAFALCFMTSNGICYAATGQTWVEKAIVYINGEAREENIEWVQEGDTLVGTVTYEVEEGEALEITKVDNFDEEVVTEGTLSLVTEDGKVYLVSDNEKLDITADFADGEAAGTIQTADNTFHYQVIGTVDAYELSVY